MISFRFISLLALLSWGIVAQAATVSFLPERTSVNVGDQFSVDINGSGFFDLSSGVISIGMDSGLQVQSVSIAPYWDLLPADTGAAQSPYVWSGIEFGTLFNPPVSGDVTIATLVFEAVNPGTSTLSILEESEFFGLSGMINPDTIASQITVSAVPLPPAVWMFLIGLGLIKRLSKSSLSLSSKTVG